MSSRITVNGHVIYHSRDRGYRSNESPETILEDQKILAQPPLPAVTRTKDFMKDPTYDITYRFVDKLPAAQGWVSAPTIMGWYGATFEEIAEWFRNGFIDAAMERGSVVRKFRVLDAAILYRIKLKKVGK